MALGAFGLTANGSATDLTITTAGTSVCTPIVGLIGMQALLVSLRLAYGSGGNTIKAYLQSSVDGGNTYFDIACVAMATTSETVLLNFSALTPKLTQIIATDGSLADDTAIDGLIGDRVRLKVVSTGIYAGSTVLSARMVAR